MREEAEILRAARQLIGQPEHWTKRAAARDAHGGVCLASSVDAVCFCAYGAVTHAEVRAEITTDADEFLNKATRQVTGKRFDFVAHYNDHYRTGHIDILALFDKAIELAEVAA